MPKHILEKLNNLKIELEVEEDLTQKSPIELWWDNFFKLNNIAV